MAHVRHLNKLESRQVENGRPGTCTSCYSAGTPVPLPDDSQMNSKNLSTVLTIKSSAPPSQIHRRTGQLCNNFFLHIHIWQHIDFFWCLKSTGNRISENCTSFRGRAYTARDSFCCGTRPTCDILSLKLAVVSPAACAEIHSSTESPSVFTSPSPKAPVEK